MAVQTVVVGESGFADPRPRRYREATPLLTRVSSALTSVPGTPGSLSKHTPCEVLPAPASPPQAASIPSGVCLLP